MPIEPKIAGLLCSAILSDTLMFRSPTCTPLDRAAAEEHPAQIHVLGEHNILNAVVAFAVGRALQLPDAEILAGIASYQPSGMRQNLLQAGKYRILADCYNSSLLAVDNTLKVLDELRLPDYIRKEVLDREGIPYEEVSDLEDVMGKLDILYMTRVQRERFFNEEDYVRLKDCYILTSKKMAAAKPDMAVLHPLPRVNEIATEVDSDPRAAYFKQAQYGVYVRMALIATLLNLAGREPEC